MNELVHILIIISRVFTGFAFAYSLYNVIISLFGIYKKKNLEVVAPKKSFALLVAAHNEEAVISDIIVSLKRLEYPKELYDIFVIADNCEDNTAKNARDKGAIVYERFDKDKKGKGFALEWMFSKIFKMDKKYDSVVIFDADNLASKNFLNEMNKKLCEGYKVVQGYLDSKNPKDTWITACYSISFWQNNRMFQLARNNMGISSQLGGTGLCIDTEILRELGWGATCLTEDLEFTCKLISNGEKVGFAHDAVVYDEKPLTLVQSWRQRRRWMQGYADVSSRYFFKLLKKGIKSRSLTAIDCAIYTVQPVLFIIMGIVAVVGFVQVGINAYGYLSGSLSMAGSSSTNPFTILTAIFTAFLYLYTPCLLALDKKLDFKIFLYYIIMPIYQLTWFPISIQGILKKDDKEWSHTEHTRSVDIDELEKAN
ncbi:Glycosyltransferase, catalytic subunit of cellulose synthase and poly-beta-1,6-N-acetylglucosamine synthase [Clostridium acidisoli DSM 12555]|uniref:Glycosyltransferase, catalytic subunit of cellulose synthase and poly-beta-1,6-N-acetylglucosamine synthase n=1 Tax=Clostridium acidisoli DSM 12555 TaxID=1121291 RepID=A0A1W1XCF4_9CLOT|nr:Glycosyltransferase, catalytic subunit of cellulose synthase and poly-beta-1,6-N-acetylglucosamine synthase [Clostridium acidisoli DSM 12555]